MAIIKAMPSEAIISGFKGVIDFYYNMGLSCVRRWPRSPGRRRSPPVMASWPIFTRAVQLWRTAPQEVRDAYEYMAGNSGLSARDMFIRGYMSGWKKLIATVDELE